MTKSLFVVALVAGLLLPRLGVTDQNNLAIASAGVPQAGLTSASGALTGQVTNPGVSNPPPLSPDYPVRVIIPVIHLNDPIIPVGTNSKNEMDVPSGTSANVGWFKYGPVPGQIGSAVLDAHVFAAFKNLKNVPVGADIYVQMASGVTRHFVVAQTTTYKLADLTSQMLFGQNDAARLNLITCAGKLTPDRSTYDHRLVLFAKLVN